MPRIRSIKPEFFTSETLARVPKSARLTFIGLWTYVDDNGVGIDNERLIAAALYPLDEDPAESLRSVSEDLRRLSEVGVLTRFLMHDRRYLFITSWDEHQKISHPGKPRYARPDAPGAVVLTCETSNPPESLPKDSGMSPETLRPEQGAGSREQGEEKDSSSSAGANDGMTPKNVKPKRITAPRFDEFWKAYPKKVGKIGAEKNYAKAIANGADPAAIIDGAVLYAMQCRTAERSMIKHPQGWLADGRWDDEPDGPVNTAAAQHSSGKPIAEVLAAANAHDPDPLNGQTSLPDWGFDFGRMPK